MSILGNPLVDWVRVLAIVAAVSAAILAIQRLIIASLDKVVPPNPGEDLNLPPGFINPEKKTLKNTLPDVVISTRLLLVLPLIAFLEAQTLNLPAEALLWTQTLATIGILFQIAIWAHILIPVFAINNHALSRDVEAKTTATAQSSIRLTTAVSRVVLWVGVTLLALESLPNIELATLVAGLGVAGIAVALALQNTLGDVFSSMLIALDKPFEVGQLVIVKDIRGKIENIGLKTTRIRSLTGEEWVVSNTELLNQPIRNLGARVERSVFLQLYIDLATDPVKLERIPALIEAQVNEHEEATFNRAHLFQISPYGLVYRYKYSINTQNVMTWMNIQQAINLGLMRQFYEMGIKFAQVPLVKGDQFGEAEFIHDGSSGLYR